MSRRDPMKPILNQVGTLLRGSGSRPIANSQSDSLSRGGLTVDSLDVSFEGTFNQKKGKRRRKQKLRVDIRVRYSSNPDTNTPKEPQRAEEIAPTVVVAPNSPTTTVTHSLATQLGRILAPIVIPLLLSLLQCGASR